jgi:hypothetical protein
MLLGSSSLEILIGVVFLFVLLSVVASAVSEIVAQAFALRSRTLHDAIATMLFDPEARNQLFNHPLIKSLSQQGHIDELVGRIARPSYIPSHVFTQAFLDKISVTRAADGTIQITGNGMPINDDLAGLIRSLAAPLGPAVANAELLGSEITKWFDESMERVSGWYKRKNQIALLVIAAVVVIWANANVLRYASALNTNPTARAMVVAAAETASASAQPSQVPDSGTAGTPAIPQATLDQLRTLDFALGWDTAAKDSRHLPATIGEIPSAIGANLLGWLLAIAAVSMGAPFWFDALKNLVNLRATGNKPPSTTDDAS